MTKLKLFYGSTDCSPEEVGYKPRVLDRLDSFFFKLIEDKKLQGASYLLARHGKVFAHKSMGFLKSWGGTEPYMPNSIRMIASITKLFTAVGIMQLVENGKLYLYKQVGDIIEEFDTEQHRKITVEHLLTHTSGMVKPDPGAMAEAYTDYFFPFWPIETREDKHSVFKKFLTGPGYNKPGKEWAYSTAGFMFLSEIISRVSGVPYFDYIMKNVIEPLGMDRTFFRVPKSLWKETCTIPDEFGFDLKTAGTWPDYLQCLSGGGGLFSTPRDLWKFGQALLNKGELNGNRILGEYTVDIMTQNRLGEVPAVCWGQNIKKISCGLGIAIDDTGLVSEGAYGHEGAGRSRLMVDPEEDFVALYFVPSSIDWLPESIRLPHQIIWSGIE